MSSHSIPPPLVSPLGNALILLDEVSVLYLFSCRSMSFPRNYYLSRNVNPRSVFLCPVMLFAAVCTCMVEWAACTGSFQ